MDEFQNLPDDELVQQIVLLQRLHQNAAVQFRRDENIADLSPNDKRALLQSLQIALGIEPI
ncbi:hypothetical protein ACERK3_19380 [Phycisphaerales bacterium AB-hyl4]|uniref:Uncharacterized protein n=1 Tax=Natronomicrosphaera hydrolytica TaxID=3242702 RepID=A0ABV4U9Z3_9BACT